MVIELGTTEEFKACVFRLLPPVPKVHQIWRFDTTHIKNVGVVTEVNHTNVYIRFRKEHQVRFVGQSEFTDLWKNGKIKLIGHQFGPAFYFNELV